MDQATETLPRSPETGERFQSAGSRLGGRPSASDEEVVARVRAGETPLFELLIRRYNQRLYRVARSILRDEQEAEDVMQHAYVSAFAHLGQFEGRARFSTWLTRIAVHEALGRARRRARVKGLDDVHDGRILRCTAQPQGRAGRTRSSRRRRQSCAACSRPRSTSCPTSYRTAFVLREAEGLDTPEVAECLEISEDAVRTRVHRARVLLRRGMLEKTGAARASAFLFEKPRCDRVVAAALEGMGLAG